MNISRFYITIILLLCAIFSTLYFVNYFQLIRSFNQDLGGIEGAVVYYLRLLKETGSLYQEYSEYPYSQTLYPPVYFYLADIITNILNISMYDNYELYLTGRCISFFSNIASAFLVWKIAVYVGANRIIALVGVAFFFIFLPEHKIAFRMDSLKDLFFIAYVYWLLKFRFEGKRSDYLLALLVSLLAVFTKHDVLLYIYPTTFVLIGSKELRKSILFISILTTLILLIALLINIYSEGLFLKNIIASSVEFSQDFYSRWMRDALYVLKYSLLILLFSFYFSIKKNNKYSALLYCTLLWLVISLLTSVRFGGAINYYSIYFLGSGILLSIVLNYIVVNTFKIPTVGLGFVFLFFIPLLWILPKFSDSQEIRFKKLYESKIDLSNYINDNLENVKIMAFQPEFLSLFPYKIVFKAYNMIFNEFLWVNYSYEGQSKIYLHSDIDREGVNVITNDVEIVILPSNSRSTQIYFDIFSVDFPFFVVLENYLICTKSYGYYKVIERYEQ